MAEQQKTKTSPAEFLRQVQTEAKKVVWPSREETVRTAIFVFIMMLILGVFFLSIDTLFSAAMQWLLSLA
jgi:preprotein translocase subunit SecE